MAGRHFNVQGELTQRKRATRPAALAVGRGTTTTGDESKGRRKTASVAEHVRQMTATSTEALQRPRKERERFRRFIVDVVTQAECVPGGRKKLPPIADAETPDADVSSADKALGVPATSSAPLTSGEKDLLR